MAPNEFVISTKTMAIYAIESLEVQYLDLLAVAVAVAAATQSITRHKNKSN